MQFFVGIVPPDDYKQKIIDFQKKWVSNNMWKIVEPHITVKAQSGLGTDLAWLDNIKHVCASFPRFPVTLGQSETFGVAVAYLSVHSGHLQDFHEGLVSAVSPPQEIMKRYMEMERFVPYLTLGQTHWGMNSEEIVDMKASAMVELAPFPMFSVEFVRVYQEIENDIYVPYEDIELA